MHVPAVHKVAAQAVQALSVVKVEVGKVVVHAVQTPVKNGVFVEAAIVPQKPTLHAQPLGTFVPAEFAGHVTTLHV